MPEGHRGITRSKLKKLASGMYQDQGVARVQTGTDLIDQLMETAFGPETYRDPRSQEYKAGAKAVLAYRVWGTKIECPWPAGTAQADAFFAGLDEGHAIWRALPSDG